MRITPLGTPPPEFSSESGVAEMTQVLRLPPGEVNLKSLCLVDEIADKVINGELDGTRVFTTGAGKVKGSIKAAMKMRALFPQ